MSTSAVSRVAFLFLTLSLFLTNVSLLSAAPLYVVRDAKGRVTFTSRKPAETAHYKVFKPQKSAQFSYYRSRWGKWAPRFRSSEYDDLIALTAQSQELEPALVKAVVHVESAFNPDAVSPKGAMGLMQLMPATAQRFGVRNAFHPEDNVKGGVKYLKLLLDRYDDDLRLALAAYNAGEGAVDQFREVPPYSETQEYVRRVLSTLKVYRCSKDAKKAADGKATATPNTTCG